MSDEATLDSAHLSRYDALQRISKILAGRHTMAELVRVLADHLHPLVAFDYLALFLHEEQTDEMRLVVLEPAGIDLPFVSMAVAAKGPAATVWLSQKSAIVPIPEEGSLHPVPRIHSQSGTEDDLLAAGQHCAPAGWRPELRQLDRLTLHRGRGCVHGAGECRCRDHC